MKFYDLAPVLHKGTLVELAGEDVPSSDNPNIYVGNIEDAPKDLISHIEDLEVVAVDASSENEYTVRVELAGLRHEKLPEHLQNLAD